MDWGYRWPFYPYIHNGGGLSAKGASANQVPTADGKGNWKWADQKGGSGIDTDAVNELITKKIAELSILSEDDVREIIEKVLIEKDLIVDPQLVAEVKNNNGVSVDGTILFTDEEGRIFTV